MHPPTYTHTENPNPELQPQARKTQFEGDVTQSWDITGPRTASQPANFPTVLVTSHKTPGPTFKRSRSFLALCDLHDNPVRQA